MSTRNSAISTSAPTPTHQALANSSRNSGQRTEPNRVERQAAAA